MSLRNLDALFKPASIAVIGASNDIGHPGGIVMRNLLAGSYLGPVMPVTGKVEAICGVLSYESVEKLPLTPDLAIICKPSDTVPDYLEPLEARGTRAALMLHPDWASLDDATREDVINRLASLSAKHGMRILGPGCLGLIVPGAGLNASLAQTDALPGRTAFVTESDSLFSTVLDWAKSNGVGFSHFISLGDQLDIDFAAALDYLSSDPNTRSILLYAESITNARRFMSAARASARNKPILIMKPGELPQAIPGDDKCVIQPDSDLDAIYDMAFRRAGIVRVDTIESLFDGARTLARSRPLSGDTVAIITNGRSIGLQAADACVRSGGALAVPKEETVAEMENLTGRHIGIGNPLVLPYDAVGETYSEAIRLLLHDKKVSAIVVLHVPFTGVESDEIASHVSKTLRRVKSAVLTCWMGADSASAARQIFSKAGIPTFSTPEKAIRAFLHMVDYRRNQELLMETPDSLPSDFFPDTTKARKIIEKALQDERPMLTEGESHQILNAYGVPVIESRQVASAKEAVIAADKLGYPVAVKIRSPQVPVPFEVGGSALDLETPEQVWDAAVLISSRVHRNIPDAEIRGFTVQRMGRRLGAHELFVSVSMDPVFGPVVQFGHGGIGKQAIRDIAVALPPLNMSLAEELISRTRISRLLSGIGSYKPADIDDICLTLIQVSQLVIDIPQITGLEINPLFADDKGVLALTARTWISDVDMDGASRLAIRPYPKELEECVVLNNGDQVTLRPIRPEDAPAHLDFLRSLTSDDLRLRFFGVVQDFSFSDMAKFTQIDYDREMAFIASKDDGGTPITLGVVRTTTSPDNHRAEFAIIIRSDLKGSGLGSLLFEKMIRYTRSRGTAFLIGETLPENKAMQGLSKKFGFNIHVNYEDEIVEMSLPLQEK